jgi:uncharacterized membrane protein
MNLPAQRITSIDFLRGVVMIIMALDHTRDYFHYDVHYFDPTDLEKTNWILFFTRFITHFCAPVFVFLAGTSAFFVGQRMSKNELSMWLLKRGIWLVIAEFSIVKLGWFFKLDFSSLFFGVIWTIGMCMIFLAALIHVPAKLAITVSLVVVFAHNTLDGIQFEPPNIIWSLLHQQSFIQTDLIFLLIGYPLIPWIFVMPLGYHFGKLYTQYDQVQRIKWLRIIGGSAVVLFFILRGLNIYGDPVPWEVQRNSVVTILSFFKVSKYPPSLLYLLITIGPAILLLSVSENWKGKLSDKVIVFGRVPMFYYIAHIYIIHVLAMLAITITGGNPSAMILDSFVIFTPELAGYGFNLAIVYAIWVALVVLLYPLCKWYNNYKMSNREKWWLSYV